MTQRHYKKTSKYAIQAFTRSLEIFEMGRECAMSPAVDEKSSPVPAILRDIIKTAEKENEKTI